MFVECLDNTSLFYCIQAIRTCWDSNDKCDSDNCNGYCTKLGPKDEELIRKIVFKHKHHSTLEHLVYVFRISGISRGCLQELVRHRIASYSVKSTRYTLKELKDTKDVKKFLYITGIELIDSKNIERLEYIQMLLNDQNYKLDELKYLIPEAYLTELVFTINARSLRNFLSLRGSSSAHFEIRELSKKILDAIPTDHRIIFEDFYKSENKA